MMMAAGERDSVDDSISCWVCLEEGADASGQPLRRDCSCRADNGFAHLSCLIEFAKTKSRTVLDRACKPWDTCPSCKQAYQRDLAFDLANAQLEFIEKEHSTNVNRDILIVQALGMKVQAIQTMDQCHDNLQLRAEGKRVGNKMLSLIKTVKPKYREEDDINCISFLEITALGTLGDLCYMDGDDAGFTMCIAYYKNLKDICREAGDKMVALHAEERISLAKAGLAGKGLHQFGDKALDKELETAQNVYAHVVKQCGESDINTLTGGMNLAKVLKRSRRSIEADRLMAKLTATSRLVHGADHRKTKEAEWYQKYCKARIIVLLSNQLAGRFQALQYIENGEKCIIQGPIGGRLDSRNEENEKVKIVYSRDLSYDPQGTVVMCYGLKSAMHLNGKIGEIRSLNEKTGRYAVYFDDKSLKPPNAEVKLQNLRLVFDVPAEA